VTKVLITGVSGFIAGQLAPRVAEKGFEVYGLERYVTNRYSLGDRRNIKTVFGDLRDHFALKNIIHDVQPDVVVHLAAISPVSYSYDHPNEVIETNFTGTVNLAELCLREVPHFKQFLYASSSETYGNGPSPKTEESPLNPNSPYAVSKAAAEKYLLYMRDAYGFPVTIMKPFNTYGRRDDTHFVIEKAIVQMLKGKEVRLGDPDPIRDFMYVEDHLSAYLTCLDEERAIGQVFNFCTGRETTILHLAETIGRLTKYKGEVAWDTIPKRPLDISVLVGDYSKAKRLLGWEPKHSLEGGLARCVDYWRDKIAGE
jgi:GDP-mannose 4,6-dehydratase